MNLRLRRFRGFQTVQIPMKKTLLFACTAFIFTTISAHSQEQAAAGAPQTLDERAGYAYGVVIGNQDSDHDLSSQG